MILSLLAATMLSKPTATAVLIHGAGGGGWEYAHWRMYFERRGLKFIAPDLLPVGGDYAKTTLIDYEAQVIGWTQGAHRPLVVIGASMGGALAVRVARRVNANAVVLINPVPPSGIEGSDGAVPDVVRWAGGPLQDTRDALPDGSENVIRWAAERWRDESGAVLRQLRAGYEFEPLPCPVLVVISGKDTDIPPASSMEFAQQLKAETVEYPNASHIGPLMGIRADRTAKDILSWLNRTGIGD
ncbi:MAG: alpha/beta hydrolase [Fimbriimonadaceae bacterium]|nr:alpha/beta hydrolase [Fimbriimonadaceae bacterium]